VIKYRIANSNDNQQLIELTSDAGMAGETSLRIDRSPDFFKLLELRGESIVIIALDDDIIIGSLCISQQNVYINGEKSIIHYIGDFKVSEKYRNQGIGLQLSNEMAKYALASGIDICFINVSKGNTKPFSFFKGRTGIPDFENIGNFKIHQLIGKKSTVKLTNYQIESIEPNDELIEFLNAHYFQYELGPVITKEKLKGTQSFVIRDNHVVIAAMCLMDTMPIKQNVLLKTSFYNQLLLKIINTLSKVLGISKMPLVNEPVKLLYIKYISVIGIRRDPIYSLLAHARNIAFERSYSFVSIGLHEKDPFNTYISKFFKLTFYSIGMIVSLKNNKLLIEKIKRGIPFEDYSQV
jgi:ribosomal protein S18 acetylase RimI-like enzyme